MLIYLNQHFNISHYNVLSKDNSFLNSFTKLLNKFVLKLNKIFNIVGTY